MIPKTIHYCWFGKGKIPEKELFCIESWKIKMPDYNIKCWDESNSPLDNDYVKVMYKRKQWAFVSDYVRLYALYTEGGIYLDTDMEVLKTLDGFLEYDCFLGAENNFYASGGIIGATKGHHYIQSCLKEYKYLKSEINIPIILTKVLNEKGLKIHESQLINGVKIFTSEYFYPLPYQEQFNISMIKEETYTIHHWSKNWEISIYRKFLRKVKNLLIRLNKIYRS